MDKMIVDWQKVIYAPTVRAPSNDERALGLWVDRTGTVWNRHNCGYLRVLRNYGFLQIIEGNGYYLSPATGLRQVSAGQVIFLFNDVPHRYYAAASSWLTRWVIFNGDFIKNCRRVKLIDPAKVIHKPPEKNFAKAFQTLQNNCNSPGKKEAFDNYHALLNMLKEVVAPLENSPAAEPAEVGVIKKFIQENCKKIKSPEEVARISPHSYSHLRKIFREHTGMSLKAYLINERINLAKTLLLDTDLPAKQIAFASGYTDYLYFMRVFKKVTGVSVGQYRKFHHKYTHHT